MTRVRYPFGGMYPVGDADDEQLQRARPATTSVHPAPEVPARPAQDGEVPTGAARVLKRARALGWTGDAGYARGTAMYATGKSGGIVESVALRMRHADGRRVVAVWERPARDGAAWKFDFAVVAPFRRVSSAELTAYLTTARETTV